MTTIRSRSLVSLAAALTLTLAVGGCAGNPTRSALVFSDIDALSWRGSLYFHPSADGREFVQTIRALNP